LRSSRDKGGIPWFIAALDRDLQLLVLEEALSASSKDILSGILPCSITLVAALDRDLQIRVLEKALYGPHQKISSEWDNF
jgi:hypothetical protein